jgi:hypothetical protein
MNQQRPRLEGLKQLQDFAEICYHRGGIKWLGITVGLHWEWEGRRYGLARHMGNSLEIPISIIRALKIYLRSWRSFFAIQYCVSLLGYH